MKLKMYKLFKKYKIPIFIAISVFSLFRIIFSIYDFNLKYHSSEKNAKLQVMVIRNEKIEEDRISYLVKLKNNKSFLKYSDSFILNIYINQYDKYKLESEEFINKYSNYSYGDVLELSGKMVIPEKLGNPYEFDYKRYLNSNNIYGTITTYSVKKVDKVFGNPILNFSYSIREDIGKKLYEKLPYEEVELFKSMVYGDDRALDEEIKKDFELTGISHLIAVSGSNVACVVALIYYICNKLNLKQKTTVIITCFTLVIFCIIASLELSIIRASIMTIVLIILKLYSKQTSKYLALLISFLCIFIYNPYCIFNIGFELSYFATLSIIFSYSLIYSYFDTKLKRLFKMNIIYLERNNFKKLMLKIGYNIFKCINTFFAITLSAQILTLPLQIYYFNSFAVSSIISNIIVVGLSSIQRVLGFATFFTINIPYMSDILVNANFVILRLIIQATKYIVNLNLPIIHIATPDIFSIISYYLVMLLFQLNFKVNRKLNRFKYIIKIKIFKSSKSIQISKGNIKNAIVILNLLLSAYIIISYLYINYFENYVIYFNVKQGNMAFIRYNRKSVIIDIGSETKGLAANVLNNFLKAKAIDNIDLILLTHMHTDHINGMFDIYQDINIRKIGYTYPKSDNSGALNEIKNINEFAKVNNISIIQLEEFDKINLQKDIEIYILSPPDNKSIKASDLENANSLIILVSIDNKSYMFMGDATKESETSLLNRIENVKINGEFKRQCLNEIKQKLKNIEVLQVGHHGSKTSTSENFLESFKFKQGVISAEKKKYGHPDTVTLDTLNRYNIKIRITEKEGTIIYKLH